MNPTENVIPFPSRRSEGPGKEFETLSRKLETRLQKIEEDLKTGLHVLESDVAKLLQRRPQGVSEKDLREDLESLAQRLEKRLQGALGNAKRVMEPQKKSSSEFDFASSLAAPLAKVLGLDFLRGILDRLQPASSESEVDAFGMDTVLLEKIKPFFDFFYYKYWRVTTTGIENIPNHGRALIVANHSGTLPYDGAMLGAAIANEHPVRHNARFLVENFVYHMPILGSLMYRIGGVRACPENAERLLEEEQLVIVFPEGVKGIGKYYGERYRLQRFGRGGFVKLCLKTKSSLIPAAIVGAEEIHPILFKSNTLAKTIGVPYIPVTPTFPLLGFLGLIPFPTKWSIHFGKPFHFGKFLAKDLEDEIRIHQTSEKVRSEIQDILYELLKKRRSVIFG